MSSLEGVYWDLDGTIANTELEAHLPAFNKSFASLGLDWYWDEKTYIDLLKINGGKNRLSYYADLKKESLNSKFILKIHKTKQEFYLKLIDEGAVKFKTGVHRLIKELGENNIRQFIVTSSSRIQVIAIVKKLFGVNNPFEFYITSEDVNYHKPNPHPYLQAKYLSGIETSNTVVFEDSNPGIKASLAAKLPTICVQSNIPLVLDKEYPVKCLLSSLGDINEHSKVLIGPKLRGNCIDLKYLINFLENL